MMGHGDSGWDWRSSAWLNSFIPLRQVVSVARLQAAKATYSSKGEPWGEVPLCKRVQRVCKSQDAPEKLGADLLIPTARYMMRCAFQWSACM